ncbi:AraC-like DNA-binding protein [Paenibacillus endophyticus]|uniref:AraC-like DNA-binding protein n=1 Tax=Paenibacillus endophyticus TaxID=1294268 RepID=A0A7W5CAP9_9BACL|nr:AraC family transcriptional regulator [Paenibacillus endophyticus]MBB3154243.1 AraC-like DNA-binding protein [Paenibacillus endophyticus]
MELQQPYGVYGYRFQDPPHLPIYQLFATGHQEIRESDYYWDGMKRIDGPLYLLQYTVSGFGQFRLGNQTHDIHPGMAFLAEIPGDHHYGLPSGSDQWTFYFVLFRQQHLKSLWSELIDTVGITPSFDPSSKVIQTLKSLYTEARMNRIQNSYQASMLIYRLIMELLQSHTLQQHEKANWPEPIKLAAAYMEEEYHRLQNLDDVADAAGLSKYYFTRMFTKTTGISPMDYVTKVRMEKAVSLLRNSPLSVEEIAFSVGYSSSSYFSKVFRSRTGFPPANFRLAKELPSIDRLQFN